MSLAEVPPRDRLATWCGGWLAAAFVLTPPLAWAAPLGFALLSALAGLACLPAFAVREEDRPAYLALLAGVVWAVGSSAWSPYRQPFWDSMVPKVVAESVLFFALVCGARRASPAMVAWCEKILAWGMALLGVLMLIEALTGASVYSGLRQAFGDPIRPDLGVKNVAQALFVLALMIGPAAVAARRVPGGLWLTAPMAAGLIVGSRAFGYDAPILAVAMGSAAAGATWLWPRITPRVLAVLTGIYLMGAPLFVEAARATGLLAKAEALAPLSWSERIGYWRHAADWVGDHPLRGWGLDASRMFSPGIRLHPHDAALQIWLELGLIGAVTASLFWAATFVRLSRRTPDLAVAAATGSAAAYLTFGAVSFGVWQEWWLGLGSLTAVAAVLAMRGSELEFAGSNAPAARGISTGAPISE